MRALVHVPGRMPSSQPALPPFATDEERGFDWGAWRKWEARAAFADSSFVFSVIQSIGGVDPRWVAAQVEPYL